MTTTRFPRPPTVALAAFAAALLVAAAPAASAHEDRRHGDLEMAVGFGTEPAYVGQPNSVQLILAHGGQPVTDLGDTLEVEVSFGDEEPMQLSLEPFFEVGGFGTPGDYRAWFIPTSAGPYTFRFTGWVDGEDVDESFTSGPQTFSEVETGSDIQYPVLQPASAEIVARIERESTRIEAATAETRAVRAAAEAAADDAASARAIGFAALAIGLLAVAGAATAVLAARRRPRPARA